MLICIAFLLIEAYTEDRLEARMDVLIKNAVIADGTGTPVFPGNIGIKDGRICFAGRVPEQTAATHILDAKGLWAAPGFIDIHRHPDGAVFRPEFGKAEQAQGLTTVIGGNCGMSAAPVFAPDFCPNHKKEVEAYQQPVLGPIAPSVPRHSMAAYLKSLEKHNGTVEVKMLCGLGTLLALGGGYTPGAQANISFVHRLMEESLQAGALGVSMGIGYAPEFYYSTEALLTYLAPIAGTGFPVTIHMRQEADGMVDGVKESIALCRALHTPVEISHLKAIGQANWRKAMPQALTLLRKAREEGLPIYQDAYPYTAGSTQLLHVLPPELADWRQFSQPSVKAAIARRIETGKDFENILRLCGYENVYIGATVEPELTLYKGMSLLQGAEKANMEPLDFLLWLLEADQGRTSMIDYIACEEDLELVLQDPETVCISDAIYPGKGCTHPRATGMTIRVLAHYARDRKLFSLEEAIRRLTSLPAKRMGLRDRGLLRPGYLADIVLFDPEKLQERGTYAQPDLLPLGIPYVYKSGVLCKNPQ